MGSKYLHQMADQEADHVHRLCQVQGGPLQAGVLYQEEPGSSQEEVELVE